ncbi:MAG: hypothetical protein ACKPKO_63370, partial [Candidatus Fonsibacter sp.]
MSEMRAHLTRGFAEMKKTSSAEVQAAMLNQAEMVARLEVDKQHFAEALAESMNEVTMLRNCYNDFEENEEGEYGNYEDDGLHRWYEAAGVGEMDYQDRVQRAAAPLTRIQDPQVSPSDIV